MEVVVIKGTNQVLPIGSTIKFEKENKVVILLEETIPYLIQRGVIEVKESVDGVANKVQKEELRKVETIEEMKTRIYNNSMNRLAKRLKWTVEKVDGYLAKLYSINKAAALTVILKEIAIEIDKKYSTHVSESEEIYTISVSRGNVFKMNIETIESFNHFAAFRTKADGELAKEILEVVFKDMFSKKNGK